MLSIKTNRRASFVFDIDGTTYAAPTAGELSIEWMDRFIEAQAQPEESRGYAIWRFLVDLFRVYADPAAIDALTTDEFKVLTDAWNEFTEESDGATSGE